MEPLETLHHQHRSRAQAEADFVPQLVRGSQLSLEKQFVQAVREAIGSGRLRPGMRLPYTFEIAREVSLVIADGSVVAVRVRWYDVNAEGWSPEHQLVYDRLDPPAPSDQPDQLD